MEFGINRRSALLDLNYCDICSGLLIPDVMHDLLEGGLQYELKLFLRHCIVQHYFSVRTVTILVWDLTILIMSLAFIVEQKNRKL